jgi:hypothetical protein
VSLGGTLREAARRVSSRRGLVAAMAAAQLLLAWIAVRPVAAAAGSLLDDRPGAARLLRGDDGLLGELLSDHRELAVGAAAGAQVALALSGILAWLFAGALVVLYVGRDDEREAAGASGVVAAIARAAPRSIAIGVVGLVVRLVPLVAAAGLGWALFADPPGGFAGAVVAASLLAVGGGLLWALATVAVDAARALALTRPHEPGSAPLSVGRAVKGGLTLVARRPGATLAIAALSTVATLAFGALDLALGHLTEAAELLHVAALLVVEIARAFVAATLIVATGLVTVAPPPARKTVPPSA